MKNPGEECAMAIPGQEIVNPSTGQRMLFHDTSSSTNGSLLRFESTSPPTDRPEPEHVHPSQESSGEVLEGTLHFRVNGDVQAVGPGEKIVIPAGMPHTFWNEGKETARSIQEFRPALNIEEFFESYFALAKRGELDEKGMPSMLRMAVMLPEFSGVIKPTSPPWPILRALCWLLEPIARARGYRNGVPEIPPQPSSSMA
jgi:mannose-6-phosphate isomerase-like protein (cupin superfamily)